MTWRRWMLVVLGTVVIGAVLFVGSVVLRFRYATGERVADAESFREAIALYSPFRDKEPEQLAHELLQAMVRGECREVLAEPEFTQEDRSFLCGREDFSPVTEFALIRRRDTTDKVTFLFRIVLRLAGGPKRIEAFANVQAERRDGAWRITRYLQVRDPTARATD